MLVGRHSASFPQQLFVDLRRAGWPVSPVLEGRVQVGGRSYRLLGIEPVTLPAELGQAPAIGRADLASFIAPPGETLVAPETLAELHLPAGASPRSERRRIAAAASRAAANGAGRAGGRYRHCATASEDAGAGFPALDRQIQRPARAARDRRRRPAPAGRRRRGKRSRTPDRQLPSEPDRVRPAVLCGRPVHRQFGDRARLRAAPADAADAARLRRFRPPAEYGAGGRAGIAGAWSRAWRDWPAAT